MSARVRIPGHLRTLYPGTPPWIEVGAENLLAAFLAMDQRLPGVLGHLVDEANQVRPWINIFVGGEDVRHLQGLATPLPPGTEVLIIPSIVGG